MNSEPGIWSLMEPHWRQFTPAVVRWAPFISSNSIGLANVGGVSNHRNSIS